MHRNNNIKLLSRMELSFDKDYNVGRKRWLSKSGSVFLNQEEYGLRESVESIVRLD